MIKTSHEKYISAKAIRIVANLNPCKKVVKATNLKCFYHLFVWGIFNVRQFYHNKLQLRKGLFMYDISKRRECKNLQVWEAIAILCKMPLNALVLFNGDEYGYLHIEEDKSAISFDDSSLDDEYEKT